MELSGDNLNLLGAILRRPQQVTYKEKCPRILCQTGLEVALDLAKIDSYQGNDQSMD